MPAGNPFKNCFFKILHTSRFLYIWRVMKNSFLHIVKKPGTTEALIWLTALLYFAIAPASTEQHFTLCAFHWLGFTHCPGCGIGRSIGFFLHGDVATSWQMHILGIPATVFLAFRVLSILTKNTLSTLKI
jgi:hypothetical protein